MIKKAAIVIGIAFAAFTAGFAAPMAYQKITGLGVIKYAPASTADAITNLSLGNLFGKQDAAPVTPSVTLTFGGDIMLDRGVQRSVVKNFAGDFGPLFKNAMPLFQSDDITFLNLEGPVSDKGHDVGSIYSFEMDPAVLPVMKNAGIDAVSFANNHVGDYTKAAFTDTMTRLTQNGIPFTGAGDSYEKAKAPMIIEKNGMKVGFLGFTDVGPNWLAAKDIAGGPAGSTAGAGILLASDPNFSSIISSAKTQVDVLVVAFHWGVEYRPHTDRQAKLAHQAIDAGADIIAGHHPHVAQDLETYKNKLIIYSMGNFIFDQYFSKETMQGLVVRTTISKDGVISNTKEYINQLDKNYAIESITEKYPTPKTSNVPGEIKIGWVGDIPPSNIVPTFSEKVSSWLKVPDIMVGNLEGALSTTRSSKCAAGTPNCYAFVGNNQFVTTLKNAGFDLVNLANNHALDKGKTGVVGTKSALTAAGLLYASENGELSTTTINGVEVAFLAFGHNSWTTKITDLAAVKKAVIAAAGKYSVVVVIFHGGAEGTAITHVPKKTETYLGENRGNVYQFAHTAIDSGADLVLGSGPHVIRGIEKYNERMIVYSAGNFMTTEGMNSKGLTGKAAAFNFTVDQNGVYKNLSILSTTGEIKNAVSEDPTNTALNTIINLTKQDFGQIISVDESGFITFTK